MRIRPKSTNYRKSFKGGSLKGYVNSYHCVNDCIRGSYGLISIECARLTARQLEASRRTRRHHINRMGKRWINVYPNVPVTSKPLEVRMGGGKGSVDYWAFHVRRGTIRYEISSVSMDIAIRSLKSAAKKRPIRTKIVYSTRHLTSKLWL